MARILIADQEGSTVEAIAQLCREHSHEPMACTSTDRAMEALRSNHPQLLVVDVKMEEASNFALHRECRAHQRQTVVIVTAALSAVEAAAAAMRLGAFDYITKPFKLDELQLCIERALEYQGAHSNDPQRPREPIYRFEKLIGTSTRMQEIYKLIGKVADTESTILIQGESGTGKELVARALHYNSARQHRPFLSINCSAMPDALLEAELFGQKKGALPGATADKAGMFEEANDGTLFLDEIDSMTAPLQTKLLRVLQERQVRRVGDTRNLPVNVRVIAASNEPLKDKVQAGSFRADLYYRLAVIPIEIPPVRERLEDVPLLVTYFLNKYSHQTGTSPRQLDPVTMERLIHYSWPGNVRELENAVERACALCENGTIHQNDLPPQILARSENSSSQNETVWQIGQRLNDFVRNQERKYIEMTLKFNQGSREKTASMLGISIATLYRKLDLKHHRDH